MPASTKRSARGRRESIHNADFPDSSPSRLAKRRKKVHEPVEPEPELDSEAEPEAEPAGLPQDQSGINLEDDELVAAVARTLHVPGHAVKAIEDNSDRIHERHGPAGVQAYAKLSGNGWTFYIKKLVNVIGRPPEGVCENAEPAPNSELGALPAAPDPDRGVDVNLGPSKMVSRHHADISFAGDSGTWNIKVHGRNGIKVDGTAIRRHDIIPLSSGQIIDIGGVEMMFVMPNDNALIVHRAYLQRAGLIAVDPEKTDEEPEEPSSGPSGSSALRGQKGTPGGLPIAPAPPDYRRPGTPLSAQSKANYTTGKSPYPGGTIVMNAEDVDLSADQYRHVKPMFSYAQLITQAILEGRNERQALFNIYKYISDNFAYYRHQPISGWQNSIRHNLSLHKAFAKAPRMSDEPGKGMIWYILPEHREDVVRIAFSRGRGGHRGSPGSPSVRQLGEGSVTKSTKSKRSQSVASPQVSSYPSDAPQFTPDRAAGSTQDDRPGDGSPLPRHRRSHGAAYGLSDNAPGSPPLLPSSYAPDEGSSFVTPAPHRVIPHLAPPSTAQRPSQHMPTSSPAPFWRYADYGGTPLRSTVFDLSPEKAAQPGPVLPPSSSPAPMRRTSAASPSRNGNASFVTQESIEELEEDEKEVEYDLLTGFPSISSFHAPSNSRTSMALDIKPFSVK